MFTYDNSASHKEASAEYRNRPGDNFHFAEVIDLAFTLGRVGTGLEIIARIR